MNLILHQLGDLVLGSVPTMVLFLLLVSAYGLLVRRPLDSLLAERRARTSGAVEQARGALAAAEAETQVVEDKLRAARAAISDAREKRLKLWAGEREAVLDDVRRAAQEHLRAAKQEIEQSSAAAQQQIQSANSELSAQVLRAVLPKTATAREVAR